MVLLDRNAIRQFLSFGFDHGTAELRLRPFLMLQHQQQRRQDCHDRMPIPTRTVLSTFLSTATLKMDAGATALHDELCTLLVGFVS